MSVVAELMMHFAAKYSPHIGKKFTLTVCRRLAFGPGFVQNRTAAEIDPRWSLVPNWECRGGMRPDVGDRSQDAQWLNAQP